MKKYFALILFSLVALFFSCNKSKNEPYLEWSYDNFKGETKFVRHEKSDKNNLLLMESNGAISKMRFSIDTIVSTGKRDIFLPPTYASAPALSFDFISGSSTLNIVADSGAIIISDNKGNLLSGDYFVRANGKYLKGSFKNIPIN